MRCKVAFHSSPPMFVVATVIPEITLHRGNEGKEAKKARRPGRLLNCTWRMITLQPARVARTILLPPSHHPCQIWNSSASGSDKFPEIPPFGSRGWAFNPKIYPRFWLCGLERRAKKLDLFQHDSTKHTHTPPALCRTNDGPKLLPE